MAEASQGDGTFRGFVAEHYDLWFDVSRGETEYSFFKECMLGNAGPALELGCGTGRLLLRYLQDGLDIDGVDYSEDMLQVCKRKAEKLGVRAALYNQPMQRLALPRKYGTIFIPANTFILLADRADAFEALRRIYVHLLDGGQLLLTLSVPQNDGHTGEWRVIGKIHRDDGATVVCSEQTFVDDWEQSKTIHYRYDVVVDGTVAQTHFDMVQTRWFYRYEFELMLELTGFKEIEVICESGPSGGGHYSSMVVSARK